MEWFPWSKQNIEIDIVVYDQSTSKVEICHQETGKCPERKKNRSLKWSGMVIE